jgi:cytoskeletal protein CcmA (bactofilin family)
VTGAEDLFIDGSIDGKITLANSSVTVGPNGVVKAEITARDMILRGVAQGKFTAAERIQIWHSAHVEGELKSERISIEEGAELRGKVEAGRAGGTGKAGEAKAQAKKVEHSKPKDVVTTDATATSDAANAGVVRP